MKISVLICSYNGADRIGNALESAVGQTFRTDHYEILVVDDGSTDHTHEIVSEYARSYPNINILRSDQNIGLPNACNLGLNQAKGDYIIRLDDDDKFD